MMRRLIPMLFTLATVAAGPLAAQAHPDFSGKWALDPSKSQGPMVPPSSDLTVTQTDKLLTIVRNSPGPSGPMSTTLVYQLDGTASKNTVGGNGMTVDLNSTTAWDGPALVISTTAPQMQGGLKQTERWSLDDSGKTLTLKGDIAVAGQTASMTLVFVKKS
jgi:hypothetical protein